jgi:hypothetical protein
MGMGHLGMGPLGKEHLWIDFRTICPKLEYLFKGLPKQLLKIIKPTHSISVHLPLGLG